MTQNNSATTSSSCPLSLRSYEGPQSLHDAVYDDNYLQVEKLLGQGADPNAPATDHGSIGRDYQRDSTPLAVAVGRRHIFTSIVELLLRSGADPDRTFGKVPRPIEIAAFHASARVVKVLIEAGTDLGDDGSRARLLMCAASRGNLDTCRVLLEAGCPTEPPFDAILARENRIAELNSERRSLRAQGMSEDDVEERVSDDGGPFGPYDIALHVAAAAGNPEVVRLLLNAGANVHAVNAHGETALHHASSPWTAEELIRAGGDVNHRDPRGKTPLSSVVIRSSVDVLRSLVRAGADIEAPDDEGWTILMSATLFASIDTVRILLELGARADAVSKFGCGTLHAAIDLCNKERVEPKYEMLVRHGAKLSQIYQGLDVVTYACVRGSAHDLRGVLRAGGDPNTCMPAGLYPWTWPDQSPLLLLAVGEPDKMKMLLEFGADPCQTSADGTTALAWAKCGCKLGEAHAIAAQIRSSYQDNLNNCVALIEAALSRRRSDSGNNYP